MPCPALLDAPPWSERKRAERFIAACREIEEAGTGTRLAVERVSDGSSLLVQSEPMEPDYRSASMGYCFDDGVWGHGYALRPLGLCCSGRSTRWM